MIRKRALGAWAISGLVLASLYAPPALGVEPSTGDVEKLIKKGNELRAAHKDSQALPLYQRAYDTAPTPRTAAQLGLCEMALSYWLAADGHLSEALRGGGDWIDDNRAVIESALHQTRRQIGEVTIAGTPAGATVAINGRVVGTLPLASARLGAGAVKVDVAAPGYTPRSQTLVVAGEANERVVIELARVAAPMDPPPSQDVGARESSWTGSRLGGVTLIVAGGLSVLGGGSLLLIDKNETCDAPTGAMCVRRNQTRTPGWTLVGVGAASVLAGLFLVYRSEAGDVAVAASSHSITVTGRF